MRNVGNVLAIDDDADILRAARIALMPHAGHVETANSPAELETYLAGRVFDVVLLDMNFVSGEHSGKAGMDALQRARDFDPTLSVVLMTAYGGVSLAVEALKAGATDFVLKPWRNEKLVDAVVVAAEKTQSAREAENVDLETLERAAIERALARHQGNISSAAAALGLSRAALYRRLAKHGL